MAVTYSEAISRISTYLQERKPSSSSWTTDVVRLEQSVGRTLARDYEATIDAPPFDNSAMDGYVLSSHKTTLASPSNPLTFHVSGSIAAGDSPLTLSDDENSMECYEMMTGAPFPLSTEGAWDACVRHEAVTFSPRDEPEAGPSSTIDKTSFPLARTITIHQPVPPRSNRKLAGEDFRRGDVLARKGMLVTPGIVMVLSSTGVDRVEVDAEAERLGINGEKKGLRIGILTTGKEVAKNHNLPTGTSSSTSLSETASPASNPTPTLQKGHIFNSNAPYLFSTLSSWGHSPIIIPPPSEDTPESFQARLRSSLSPDSETSRLDLIITTGGVSAGKHDYVPSSVLQLGGNIVFHKTVIRPGFPVMFGEIPASEQGKGASVPIFGLPGNPIAVAACLRFLVAEFLQGSVGSGRPSQGMRVARLLPLDYATSRGEPPAAATIGCGVEKMPQDVTALPEQSRGRSHKKPLMTRCFLPSKLHYRRPPGAGDPNGNEANIAIPGLELLQWVEPLTRSASLTKAMSEAGCWVILPEGKEVFQPGEIVEVVNMKPE